MSFCTPSYLRIRVLGRVPALHSFLTLRRRLLLPLLPQPDVPASGGQSSS